MAKFRLTEAAYIVDRLHAAGEVIDLPEGHKPSEHMEPVEAPKPKDDKDPKKS